jgi:hypothetical protein
MRDPSTGYTELNSTSGRVNLAATTDGVFDHWKIECPGCKMHGCRRDVCNGVRKCKYCMDALESKNSKDICSDCRISELERKVGDLTAMQHPCHLCHRERGSYMCPGCNLPTCGWSRCGRRDSGCAMCVVDEFDMCKKTGCKKRRVQANVNPNFGYRRHRPHRFCEEHACLGLGVRHDICENELPPGEIACEVCRYAPPEPPPKR